MLIERNVLAVDPVSEIHPFQHGVRTAARVAGLSLLGLGMSGPGRLRDSADDDAINNRNICLKSVKDQNPSDSRFQGQNVIRSECRFLSTLCDLLPERSMRFRVKQVVV